MKFTILPTLAGCLVVAISLAGVFYYQAHSYSVVNAALKQELARTVEHYQKELNMAQTALQSQNEAIEIYQADLAKTQSSIAVKEKELSANRQTIEAQILKELQEDSSSDSQLNIINRILHGFSK